MKRAGDSEYDHGRYHSVSIAAKQTVESKQRISDRRVPHPPEAMKSGLCPTLK
jgi:hypothetical protein